MVKRYKFRWLAIIAISPLLAQQPPPEVPVTQVFADRCAACHGAGATGTDRGPGLSASRRLRTRSEQELRDIIRNGTPAGMPAFALPEAELTALARFVRSMNASASDLHPAGDAAAGEAFFFGKGQCAECHTARGRGRGVGPDLSGIGRQATLAEITRKLKNPGASVPDNYATVTIKLRDGTLVRGYARKETLHTIQLQEVDGRLLLLGDGEYTVVSREKTSQMPALRATADEERNLIAYLSGLSGATQGALPETGEAVPREAIDRILRPKTGEWPTYNGNVSANRHSPLEQINTRNVGRLAMRWAFAAPYFGLEATPLVSDGIMFVSGPNQVYALDARNGQEIWRYSRPRSNNSNIAADAAKGANRGVALLGDRVFFMTDDARLVCLDRLTGAVRWDVFTAEEPQRYGGTVAPLVVGDLVITGVAGADEGIRGFVAAFKATTGRLVWRFWTIPRKGDPGWDTWQGNAVQAGGGSTWLTGSYDPESRVLYWPTGNPFPDSDASDRKGDNLYTNCILALDPETGRLKWHYQFTPADLHDWDATEPPVLVDASFSGRPRKLLLHADRNGFFYVLDRTSGEVLLAKPFAKKITWASGIDAQGRPIELSGNVPTPEGTRTCPDIRGATNWMSTAFHPDLGLYYLMTVENCGVYRSTQFGPAAGAGRGGAAARGATPGGGAGRGGRGGPIGGGMFIDPNGDPPRRYLRALDVQTGRTVWEIEQKIPGANYGGVLSTAGGVVFYSESAGAFSAVDAKTGEPLWHFETGQPPKASPMTYTVDERQYVAIAAGANVFAFALPDRP